MYRAFHTVRTHLLIPLLLRVLTPSEDKKRYAKDMKDFENGNYKPPAKAKAPAKPRAKKAGTPAPSSSSSSSVKSESSSVKAERAQSDHEMDVDPQVVKPKMEKA